MGKSHMMSDYIKIVLNSNYEFRCDGELSLYGMRFVMLSFKIDTGCQYSVLPLIRTGLPQNMILQYRDLDFSDSKVGKLLSYGVMVTQGTVPSLWWHSGNTNLQIVSTIIWPSC